jgi:hypothetical protein
MRVEHANYKGQRNVRCWRWMSDDAADSIIPVSTIVSSLFNMNLQHTTLQRLSITEW